MKSATPYFWSIFVLNKRSDCAFTPTDWSMSSCACQIIFLNNGQTCSVTQVLNAGQNWRQISLHVTQSGLAT